MGFLSWLTGEQPEDKKVQSVEERLQEEKEALTEMDYEEGMECFQGVVDLEITENIIAQTTHLHFTGIRVHGKHYSSLKEALLDPNLQADADEHYELLSTGKEMEHMREYYEANHIGYKKYPTTFDGDVYIYKPGKRGLWTESRKQQELPPRLFVHIEQDSDGACLLTDVYMPNQQAMGSGYEFNMVKDIESFLVLIQQNPEYVEEMIILKELIQRINKHATLVRQGRIRHVDEDQIIIAPPTPNQITERGMF